MAKKPTYPDTVDATPVKSFFVHMLTRDIELKDAVLDLLDNCVDGIQRRLTKRKRISRRPYAGYRAEITFGEDSFCIHDNCGGIPWQLHAYAFRMGPDQRRQGDSLPTVGTYGIGMKRAIFKIGRACLISTKHENAQYEVEITPEWLDNPDLWRIPVREAEEPRGEDGTTVYVDELRDTVKTEFSQNSPVEEDLIDTVSTHYAFIINKGFTVTINGQVVRPRPTELAFSSDDKKSIRPYIYKTEIGGVKVFLAVGLTRPIPSKEEAADSQDGNRYSSLGAGWTVVCNDRAVLYSDKTEGTGWGEAGVPQYHTQFIAISGIVEFTSADASLLPTTTTKHGINGSSPLYLQVKNRMREGLSTFTQYTNQWKEKALAQEARETIRQTQTYPFEEIRQKAAELTFSRARGPIEGKVYKPSLPKPPKKPDSKQRIAFSKPIRQIETVSEYLFGDNRHEPSEVGTECFDTILREAEG